MNDGLAIIRLGHMQMRKKTCRKYRVTAHRTALMCSQLAMPVMGPFCSLVRPCTVSSWGKKFNLGIKCPQINFPSGHWKAYLTSSFLQHLCIVDRLFNLLEDTDLTCNGHWQLFIGQLDCKEIVKITISKVKKTWGEICGMTYPFSLTAPIHLAGKLHSALRTITSIFFTV